MNDPIDNTRAVILVTIALGTACAPARSDTAAPEADAVAVETQPSAVPEPEPGPDTSQCSVEHVLAALDGSAPWTHNEGAQCLEALGPRCEGSDGTACYAAALIGFSGVGGAARDSAAAEQHYRRACDLEVSDACRDLAWFIRDGIVGQGDPSERMSHAHALLSRACELGDAESCQKREELQSKPEPEPEPEPAALVTVQDANASSSRSEVDGLVLEELRCAVSRPLLGIIAVSGALAQRKTAFDKCAKSGAAFVTHFDFKKGKAKNVTVEGGTATQNRCMVKALSATKAPLDARCGAVVLVGKPAGARASLAALRESATP